MEDLEHLQLKQTVAFCILMQNNQGIISKAAGYILEKLEETRHAQHPERLLDDENLALFNAWMTRFARYFEKE